MILAAGLGTRLGQITQTKPKCLVEVKGKTLLEHAVDRLKEVGVDYIVINTHHFADQVAQFVKQRANFGITVHLSYEEALLDTGGGVYKARSHFTDCQEFLVHNADVYHHLDLHELIRIQQQSSSIGTLLVMSRPSKRYLVFDNDCNLIGRVVATGESELVRDSTVQNLYAFSGLQIVSPKIFKYCDGLAPQFSIIEAYLRAASDGNTVHGMLVSSADWSDVGTPERLQALQ